MVCCDWSVPGNAAVVDFGVGATWASNAIVSPCTLKLSGERALCCWDSAAAMGRRAAGMALHCQGAAPSSLGGGLPESYEYSRFRGRTWGPGDFPFASYLKVRSLHDNVSTVVRF